VFAGRVDGSRGARDDWRWGVGGLAMIGLLNAQDSMMDRQQCLSQDCSR
jgi:hypothetical protein